MCGIQGPASLDYDRMQCTVLQYGYSMFPVTVGGNRFLRFTNNNHNSLNPEAEACKSCIVL